MDNMQGGNGMNNTGGMGSNGSGMGMNETGMGMNGVEGTGDTVQREAPSRAVGSESEKKKPKKEKKPFGKKQKIIVGVVVAALLICLVGVGMNTTKKSGSSSNYFTMWKTIVNNELGSFRFTLDVRTAEHEDGKEVQINDSVSVMESLDTVEDTESVDSTETGGNTETGDGSETGGSDATETQSDVGDSDDVVAHENENLSDTWNNVTGTSGSNWKYPNYQLIIEGCALNTEPLECSFTINLATTEFNRQLTDVICGEGKVYVNVESLRYWMMNSKSNYLVEYAGLLPESSKYVEIDENAVKFSSGYAEEAEQNKGYYDSILGFYRCCAQTLKTVLGVIEDNLGGTGLAQTSDDVYSISLTDENSSIAFNLVKNLLVKRSDVYDANISAMQSNGYINDEQYTQKLNEKDNFLKSTESLYRNLQMANVDDMDLKVVGNGRMYTGGTGLTNVEAELQLAFTFDNVDYQIGIGGMRSGKAADIIFPNGSSTSVEQEDIVSAMRAVINYLNITGCNLDEKLEVTPTSISDVLLDEFVELVNNTDATSTEITRYDVRDFISRYTNYKQDESTTPDDVVNAQLVLDFLDGINGITGGIVEEKTVEVVSEIDQFREVDKTVKGIRYIAKVDEDASDDKLCVVNVTFINDTDSKKTIDLTKLSLKNVVGSRYPMNNSDVIRSYDNKFDMNKLKDKVTVDAHGYTDAVVYTVLDNGYEYMDLMYGDKKLGDLIAR